MPKRPGLCMYTIYLATFVAVFFTVVPTLFGVSFTWTTVPGIILGILTYVWVNRRAGKRVEAVTQAADAEMASLQQLMARPPATPAQQKQLQAAAGQKIQASVEILKQGFIFQKWQLGAATMLNARIGMLLFVRWAQMQQGSPTDALPYLEKSRVKGVTAKLMSSMWPAWAMLAVCYYKGENALSKAAEVLEEAVKHAAKEGLLWSLYAWMLEQEDQTDAAIDVLARGKAGAADDGRLAENLTLLQNGKKMQMRAYGEQWYQFGLERPRIADPRHQQPRMAHPRARGGRRR
ncbi:MAG: hypothetical protein H6702_19410 [Myxococcales bacterium]|nr:hypothetical protein [Myxococcales bacterium]